MARDAGRRRPAHRGGATLGAGEALSPERALALFTTPADAPGGAPRRLAPGARADLCLLDRPWARARDALASDAVAATFRSGPADLHAGAVRMTLEPIDRLLTRGEEAELPPPIGLARELAKAR